MGAVQFLAGHNRLTTRSNAFVAGTQEFHNETIIHRPYGNSFSYSAETSVFDDWLAGKATRSSLASHLASTALLQTLAESVRDNGKKITIDFSYASMHEELRTPNGNERTALDYKNGIQFAAYTK